MTTTKIDANTIKFSRVIPQEIIPEKTVDVIRIFEFLVEQKVAVETDLANLVARHAKEKAEAEANVAEVVMLLADCKRLGVEAVKEPEPEVLK